MKGRGGGLDSRRSWKKSAVACLLVVLALRTTLPLALSRSLSTSGILLYPLSVRNDDNTGERQSAERDSTTKPLAFFFFSFFPLNACTLASAMSTLLGCYAAV